MGGRTKTKCHSNKGMADAAGLCLSRIAKPGLEISPCILQLHLMHYETLCRCAAIHWQLQERPDRRQHMPFYYCESSNPSMRCMTYSAWQMRPYIASLATK